MTHTATPVRDAVGLQDTLLARREARQAAAPGYTWVYLWHWPIRAMHWIAAVSIVVLAVTGFYIGRPYFLTGGHVGSFAMQWTRLVHFIAAGALVATAVVRIYWLWAGNRFERWHALLPVRPRDLKNMVRTVRYYLLIHPERGPHYLGHNPLQQLAYTFTYLVAGVLVLTGFALFGLANPGGFIHALFGWVTPLFGGAQMVRAIHHTATWYFPLFVILHVYLAVRSDLMERGGTMSSIVSGGRFVPADADYVDG